MTRPTLKGTTPSVPLTAATAVGFVIGVILLIAVNIAIATGIVAFALNTVGGFGLSFWKVVGLGILFAQVSPVLQRSA